MGAAPGPPLLQTWLAVLAEHGVTSSALLRLTGRHGGTDGGIQSAGRGGRQHLSGQTINLIVKTPPPGRAGPPETYTAHGLRVGGATFAAKADAPMPAITTYGRWADSSPTVAGWIQHSVQTNATLIDDEWCDLLARYQVRVGVSIDGPAALNARRVDLRGRPAFDRIVRNIRRLHDHGIRFSRSPSGPKASSSPNPSWASSPSWGRTPSASTWRRWEASTTSGAGSPRTRPNGSGGESWIGAGPTAEGPRRRSDRRQRLVHARRRARVVH
ncbi:radical SAM protein (plasmid) [Streptosporangium sp. CA-135522]|uniref:radical SAM protein n=1 Tax=Streptosporangium sp. CA-135522 TaxID=3240072 RepID=UPI003D8EF9F4